MGLSSRKKCLWRAIPFQRNMHRQRSYRNIREQSNKAHNACRLSYSPFASLSSEVEGVTKRFNLWRLIQRQMQQYFCRPLSPLPSKRNVALNASDRGLHALGSKARFCCSGGWSTNTCSSVTQNSKLKKFVHDWGISRLWKLLCSRCPMCQHGNRYVRRLFVKMRLWIARFVWCIWGSLAQTIGASGDASEDILSIGVWS